MKLALHWRIFIGLILGGILGYFFSLNNIGDPNPSIMAFKLSYVTWIGDLFLKLLKMIVLPLIISSIITGVSHIPIKSLGQIGFVTLLVFKGQMLLSAILGLFFVNLFKPGLYIDLHKIIDAKEQNIDFITESKVNITDLFMSMLPENIFAGLAHGDLVPVIIFCIVIALALAAVPGGEALLKHVRTILAAILLITHWIMELAPFGIFALICKTVAIGGLNALLQYGPFVLTVLSAFFTLLFLVGSLMVHFFTDFSPLEFFAGMREAMLTAFSTSSSAATIPVSLETMENKFHVSEKVASFLIPLGATMNMNGAAIYEAVVTLFVAQAWLPEPLSLSKQIFVLIMVLIATFGTPGIPHGSLVTLAVVFEAVGLPIEAIAVILSIDRILDMTRTMINVSFDCLSCLILNKLIDFDKHDLHKS